jgi:hypothetical protein
MTGLVAKLYTIPLIHDLVGLAYWFTTGRLLK